MTYQPSTALPPDLLQDDELQRALSSHDFGTAFRLARERAGISYSRIAAECDIKPERVGTLARGQGRITTFEKVQHIADALRVPGGWSVSLPARGRRPFLPSHPAQRTDRTCVVEPSSK